MKLRKILSLCLLLCATALLCTACSSTTALDNLSAYYSEVGTVLDEWFSSSSDGGDSGSDTSSSSAAALDAPGSFTLAENGDYSFTGVANADYYLVYFCAPDATGDSDPFLFSSSSIDATGTGGETYSGNIDDLVQYGYGEYLVKVFAFPDLNDSAHAMSTAAMASYSFSGTQDAPVIDYFWNTFTETISVELTNIDDYTYQAYPDSVEIVFTDVENVLPPVTLTMEDLSPDNYTLESDALTSGTTYRITATSYSDNEYVTNPISDSVSVSDQVTFAGINVITDGFIYSDGIARGAITYPRVNTAFSLSGGTVAAVVGSFGPYSWEATPTQTSDGSDYSYTLEAHAAWTMNGTLELHSDGTLLMRELGNEPTSMEGFWLDNGDGTATLCFNPDTLQYDSVYQET